VGFTTQTFYPQSASLEFIMPRLIGKQSNPAIPLSLLILATVGVVTALEYIGLINVINGFGNDRLEIRIYSERPLN
jgi:hypothetical protein